MITTLLISGATVLAAVVWAGICLLPLLAVWGLLRALRNP